MASGLFKKKQNNTSSDLKDLSVSEAALSQSTFNIEKITDIQSRFRGGDVLLVPGRIFIRDGVLWKVCRKGPKKRHFFLFNDTLVYGTVVSRGHYGNQHIMALSSMSVSPDCHYMPQVNLEGDHDDKDAQSPSELKPENAFQINHSDKSFHVYSHTRTDKSNWITNINKQITKINKNRDPMHHMYQKAVWVPDAASKQCMICKQKFSAFVRKHHCRMCGRVVCSACSPEKADIAKLSGAGTSGKIERICKHCKKPVILVTGGGVMGMEQPNDDIIEINTTTSTPATDHDDGEDSSETEDSDDSEIEDMPVPPPRKKKNQLNKSPEPKKKNGPPPRPSYTPAKSIIKDDDTSKNKEDQENDKIPVNEAIVNTPGIEETDSGQHDEQPSPKKTINDRIKSDVVKGRPKPPRPGTRPTRPGSGPPRSGSGPPKPGSNSPMSGSNSPMSGSGSDSANKPVPKPRKTISKKDTEKEPDSGSDTPASMESPPQDHKLQDRSDEGDLNSTTEDAALIMEDETGQKEPNLDSEGIDNSELEENKSLEQQDDEKDDQELVQEGTTIEQHEPVYEEDNLQQEDADNKEIKSLVNKRRKQKITKPIEDKTEDTETPDPVTDSSITQAFTDDLLPREKTFRSPSTHARQRRSKFAIPQSN